MIYWSLEVCRQRQVGSSELTSPVLSGTWGARRPLIHIWQMSVNPISTREGRLSPPISYYWHPQCFSWHHWKWFIRKTRVTNIWENFSQRSKIKQIVCYCWKVRPIKSQMPKWNWIRIQKIWKIWSECPFYFFEKTNRSNFKFGVLFELRYTYLSLSQNIQMKNRAKVKL